MKQQYQEVYCSTITYPLNHHQFTQAWLLLVYPCCVGCNRIINDIVSNKRASSINSLISPALTRGALSSSCVI